MQQDYVISGAIESGNTEVQVTPENIDKKAPKKKVKKKSKLIFWIIFGITAFVIICAVVISLLLFSNKDKFIRKKTDIVLFTNSDNEILIYINGKKIDTELEGNYRDKHSSLRGDVCMFWTVPHDTIGNDPRELYCVRENDVSKIASDINNYRLSLQGTAAAYIEGMDELHKIDLATEDSTYIANNVSNYAISPDGSAVAYAVAGYGNSSVYYFDGEESILIDDDFPMTASVIGVSNNADCIYIKSGTDGKAGSLYRYTSDEKTYTELCNDFGESVYLNSDNTQILYTTIDGSTFVATQKDDVKELYADNLKLVLPSNVISCDGSVGIKNFFDCFYTSSGNSQKRNIHYVDKKGVESKIVLDVTSVQISCKGDRVYYLRDYDTLCQVKAKSDAGGTVLAEDISSYELTQDNNAFYFIKDSDLYFGTNEKTIRPVKENISTFSVINGNICLIQCNDGLFQYNPMHNAQLTQLSDKNYLLKLYPNSAYYVEEVLEKPQKHELFAWNGTDDFDFTASSEYFKEFNNYVFSD